MLVRGDLSRTILTQDLSRVLALEGCLSGNVPKKGLRSCRPCAASSPSSTPPRRCTARGPSSTPRRARSPTSSSPPEASAAQADRAAEPRAGSRPRRGDPPAEQERLAQAARQAVQAQFLQQALQLGLRYGLTDVPRINDPSFVSTLVFDSRAATRARPSRASPTCSPSKNAALIQIRLRPGLSEEERRRAIELIGEATGQKAFQPKRGGRALHRHRRAGGHGGAGRRRPELDLRAAGGGAAAHGRHAGAGVPLAPAAAAARAAPPPRR